MGCNCKKLNQLQDKYGVEEEETILERSIRYGLKMIMFFLTLIIGLITVPILLSIIIWKMFFVKKNDKPTIVLPQFWKK